MKQSGIRIFGWAALVVLAAGTAVAQRVVTTVAGSPLLPPADGTRAANAALGRIFSVSVDPNGNPVFADPYFHTVFVVEPGGALRALAGNGVAAFSGDGGPANLAALKQPGGTAFDSAGNLYIADTYNHRIRMVTPQGTISTVAGTGRAGFGGDGGPATLAEMDQPLHLAVARNGDLFFVDAGNFRIRRITNGVISSVVARSASSPLGEVEQIAVHPSGDLYFAEFTEHRVRRFSQGQLTTVAGTGRAGFSGDNGPASAAQLSRPTGLAFDGDGNLVIMDAGNRRLRRVNLATGTIVTIAGGQSGFCGDGGPATGACFRNPFGIAISLGGDLFLADRDNFRIRRIQSGGISTIAGSGLLLSQQTGVPAVNALLVKPEGVSLDGNGNLIISDGGANQIRRVGNNSVVETLAGNGAREDTGDGGQARSAGLARPTGSAVDANGNLYIADADNHRVRRIAADGTITTFAGNGNAGFSGDGGLAVQASLFSPTAVAFDRNGNLYIADLENSRIRRVAGDGRISTFVSGLATAVGVAVDTAGNILVSECGRARIQRYNPSGSPMGTVAGGGNLVGAAADGGPATSARLVCPVGMAIDAQNHLYFADYGAQRVRMVTASGVITTLAGNGRRGFAGDGSSGAAASFSDPFHVAVDRNGTVYVADSGNSRIRALLGVAPTFTTSTNTLPLTATGDGVVTEPVSFRLNGTLPGLAYSLSTCGQDWLKLTATSGAMPATAELRADPTGLAAGQYNCAITITAPGASPASRTVMANLTVRRPEPAKLAVDNAAIHLSFARGADPVVRQWNVRNAGSGRLVFQTTTALVNGEGWLEVTPALGEATPGTPGLMEMKIDPSRLNPGTYNASVTVARDDGSESAVIPIYVSVSAARGKMLLSQSGLTFTALVQGGAPLAQRIHVLNSGTGAVDWEARATTTSGGDWLRLSSSSGRALPGSENSAFAVTIDPSLLSRPDTYYGQIRIESPGADNSPQFVTVIVNALNANSTIAPDIQPSVLMFVGKPGESPGAQTVSIANVGRQALNYRVARVAEGGWLDTVPASATLAPGEQGRIVVQPDFSALEPGTWRGKLNLSLGDTSRTIDVVAIVPDPAAGDAKEGRGATACNTVTVDFEQPANALAVAVGQAVTLRVRAVDSCGAPFGPPNNMRAQFSNGEPELTLEPVGNGVWSRSWVPRRTGAATIQVNALRPGVLGVGGIALRAINVVPETNTPRVVPGAVANAASFLRQVPVAPGSYITIGGERLADATATKDPPPLPIDLSGTRVLLGTQSLPLQFVSDGQLNVQIPYGLAVNTELDLTVQRGNALSNPEKITVALAQPAAFTQNAQGNGPAFVYVGENLTAETLVTPSRPAKAGDAISILCTGLGDLVEPIEPGVAPAALIPTRLPVEVLIGGVAAQVRYSGLRPGAVGQYVVYAVVPAGVAPGGDVSVTLRVAGQPSPAGVTMAIAP